MHADDAGTEEAVAEVPATQVDDEEETDPGKLVSVWYTMKNQYEETLAALKAAAGQLNAIGSKLKDDHGIIVPRVSAGEQMPAAPQAVAQAPEPVVARGPEAEATPAEGSWSPPSQHPVQIDAPATTVQFVEELRRDASVGDNEKGFADHIGKMFSSFQSFGQG